MVRRDQLRPHAERMVRATPCAATSTIALPKRRGTPVGSCGEVARRGLYLRPGESRPGRAPAERTILEVAPAPPSRDGPCRGSSGSSLWVRGRLATVTIRMVSCRHAGARRTSRSVRPSAPRCAPTRVGQRAGRTSSCLDMLFLSRKMRGQSEHVIGSSGFRGDEANRRT